MDAHPRLNRFVLIGLLGGIWWTWVLHGGWLVAAGYDWPWTMGYLRVVQEALRAGVLPLYRVQAAGLPWVDHADNRVGEYLYWAHPQTPMHPLLLALTVLSPPRVFLLQLLAMYAIGFGGLVALARRYQLSVIPFALCALLLFANGCLQAKICAWGGWEAAFLLPWLVYFVLGACDGERTIATAIWLGTILALIVYQGQIHVLAYIVIFLAAFAVTAPWCAPWVAVVGVTIAIVGAARLVPIAAMYPLAEAAHNTYIPGYTSFEMLRDALTVSAVQGKPGYRAWWEFDMFIGPLGLVFILLFGVMGLLFVRPRHLQIAPACGLLAVWATQWPKYPPNLLWCDYYRWKSLGIPVLSSERCPSRFLLIPLVFLSVIACIALQRAITAHRAWRVVGLGVLIVTAAALQLHVAEWRANLSPGGFETPELPHLLVDPPRLQTYETNLPRAAPPQRIVYDTTRYRRAIAVGTLVTLGGLLIALPWAWRREMKAR